MKLGASIFAVVALIIIILIVAYLAFSGGTPTLSATNTVSLPRNSSYDFYIAGDSNVSSLMVASTSAENATIYLGRRPLLLSAVSVVNLTPGQSKNVSIVGSSTADINVLLVSSTAQSATVTIRYLPSDSGVAVSPGVKIMNMLGANTRLPAVTTTTNATTTNSLNTTSAKSSTTTVAASTTIAQQVNATAESIIAVNGSNIGEMINGYRRIFTKQKLECTAGIYDNEFANVYGMVPSGGLTFQNASLTTPTGIISSGIGVGNNLYSITYTEVVAAGNKPFALVQYNLSGNYIMSSKFNGGFGNTYSAVLLNYTQLNSTQDVCRIFGV